MILVVHLHQPIVKSSVTILLRYEFKRFLFSDCTYISSVKTDLMIPAYKCGFKKSTPENVLVIHAYLYRILSISMNHSFKLQFHI